MNQGDFEDFFARSPQSERLAWCLIKGDWRGSAWGEKPRDTSPACISKAANNAGILQTRLSVEEWLKARPRDRGANAFPSRVHGRPHLSARQYARIVRGWIEGAGMDASAYGTHSMRRTKVAQIYRKTGNLRAVQLLLGHSKIESTVRYLGIEVDDALTLSEQVEL